MATSSNHSSVSSTVVEFTGYHLHNVRALLDLLVEAGIVTRGDDDADEAVYTEWKFTTRPGDVITARGVLYRTEHPDYVADEDVDSVFFGNQNLADLPCESALTELQDLVRHNRHSMKDWQVRAAWALLEVIREA